MNRKLLFLLMALSFSVGQAFANLSGESGEQVDAPALEASSESSNNAVNFVYSQPAQSTNVVVTNPVNYADSVTYYNRLANEQEFYGRSRNTGIALLIPGVLATVGGITLATYVMSNDEEYCDEIRRDDYSYECELNGRGALLLLSGMTVGATGVLLTTIGTIKLIVGSKRLSRAKAYRRKAESFSQMQGAQLYIKPEFDMFNRSMGAKFALQF